MGGVLGRTQRPLLGPVQRLPDRARQEVAGGRALDHADRQTIDTSRRAARSLPRRLLHAGQAGVDVLDRGVRLVDVQLDDEFELIGIGHLENARVSVCALRNDISPRWEMICLAGESSAGTRRVG